jgi:alcohol dehydrogenase class IV
MDPYATEGKSVEAVKKLLLEVNIPHRLLDYGIKADHIPSLVQGGLE